MADKVGPFRLAPWFSERVWGREDLRPWYPETGARERVGEAWLTGPESVVETGPLAGQTLANVVAAHPAAVLGGALAGEPEFPLLVKMLFPQEKLSVQVHPDDAHAQAMGQARGKTECWYVLEALPGAAVALGVHRGTTEPEIRAAVANGTMEELMEWLPVAAGDMVFVDAGTVHAIGPGLVILETQQTCDTTFRMYDYGRPRELHVEQGLRVMKAATSAGKVEPRTLDGCTRLIEQRYFTVDRYDLRAGESARIVPDGPGCVAAIAGSAVVECASFAPVELSLGHAVVLPAGAGAATVRTDAGAAFVRCFAPQVG